MTRQVKTGKDYGKRTMTEQVHSIGAILLMKNNLRDMGDKMIWHSLTLDDIDGVHAVVRALIEDDMFYLLGIDAQSSCLNRITVYQADRAKIIDLSFSRTFQIYDREHKS